MSWQERAACRDLGDLMFPENNTDLERALLVCSACPVRTECLDDCMATEQEAYRSGVRGGLNAPDRRRLTGWGEQRQRRWDGPRGRIPAPCASSDPQPVGATVST